jgi:hypothetical protein
MTIKNKEEELALKDGGKYRITKLDEDCVWNSVKDRLLNKVATFRPTGYMGYPAFEIDGEPYVLLFGYEVEPV